MLRRSAATAHPNRKGVTLRVRVAPSAPRHGCCALILFRRRVMCCNSISSFLLLGVVLWRSVLRGTCRLHHRALAVSSIITSELWCLSAAFVVCVGAAMQLKSPNTLRCFRMGDGAGCVCVCAWVRVCVRTLRGVCVCVYYQQHRRFPLMTWRRPADRVKPNPAKCKTCTVFRPV